jgi:hypothetical protein
VLSGVFHRGWGLTGCARGAGVATSSVRRAARSPRARSPRARPATAAHRASASSDSRVLLEAQGTLAEAQAAEQKRARGARPAPWRTPSGHAGAIVASLALLLVAPAQADRGRAETKE